MKMTSDTERHTENQLRWQIVCYTFFTTEGRASIIYIGRRALPFLERRMCYILIMQCFHRLMCWTLGQQLVALFQVILETLESGAYWKKRKFECAFNVIPRTQGLPILFPFQPKAKNLLPHTLLPLDSVPNGKEPGNFGLNTPKQWTKLIFIPLKN